MDKKADDGNKCSLMEKRGGGCIQGSCILKVGLIIAGPQGSLVACRPGTVFWSWIMHVSGY